jgi:amino acid adenylation domain-containing protein
MLERGFLRSAARFPERPALDVAGVPVSYEDLRAEAAAIAVGLVEADAGSRLTAVFAQHTRTAYAGVLGALLAGRGYVPLNTAFPLDRTAAMLERSGCQSVITESGLLDDLHALLDERRLMPVIVVADADDVTAERERFRGCVMLGRGDLDASRWQPVDAPRDSLAYLLFTSGSTGVPKGVMVTRANVGSFVSAMVERYQVNEHDRFSQTFDLTFDLSAFDMFVAWEAGACVCVPPAGWAFRPGRYVEDAALTIWFSVPSVGLIMRRLGALKPGRFTELKWVLFCGEPLPADLTESFAAAAPDARVENLYGPTEATIACTLYRWDPVTSPAECHQGIVPIGEPYPEMKAIVVDSSLIEIAAGEAGELLVTGPQVAAGYLSDPERTNAAFVTPPGTNAVHYRTGDLVRRRPAGGPIVYLGRIDDQIKVSGYRVELGEVEAALREASGVDEAIAVGWPRNEAGAEGLVAFLGSLNADPDLIRTRLDLTLPPYMVPRRFELLESLPRNANGKYDRNALLLLLEAEGADPGTP